MHRYFINDSEEDGIKILIQFIKDEQFILEHDGSCGDGSFDSKERRNDIDRCKIALSVIKEISGVE